MKKLFFSTLTTLTLLVTPNLLTTNLLKGILGYLELSEYIQHKNPVQLCNFVNHEKLIDFKTYNSTTKVSGAELYNPQQNKFIVTDTTPDAEYYPDFLFYKHNPLIFTLVNYLRDGTQTTLYDLQHSNIIRDLFKGGDHTGFAHKKLFVSKKDKQFCMTYNLATSWQETLKFDSEIRYKSTTPDGNNIFFTTKTAELYLYIGKKDKFFRTSITTDAHFSADSKYLLYDHKKIIYLYDLKEQRNLPIIRANETISTLEFSPNGDYVIYSTHGSKFFYYYNIATKKTYKSNHNGVAIPDQSSPDGTLLSYHFQINGRDSNITQIHNLTNAVLKTVVTEKTPLHTWFNKDNSIIMSSLPGELGVVLHEYPSIKKYDTITINGEDDYSIPHISPNNKTILVVSDRTKTYKVYDIEKKEIIKTGDIGYFNFANAFKFHPNPSRPVVFIVNDDHKSLEILNYKTGKSFLLSTQIQISAFNLKADGKQMVISFENKTSKVYNLS